MGMIRNDFAQIGIEMVISSLNVRLLSHTWRQREKILRVVYTLGDVNLRI